MVFLTFCTVTFSLPTNIRTVTNYHYATTENHKLTCIHKSQKSTSVNANHSQLKQKLVHQITIYADTR